MSLVAAYSDSDDSDLENENKNVGGNGNDRFPENKLTNGGDESHLDKNQRTHGGIEILLRKGFSKSHSVDQSIEETDKLIEDEDDWISKAYDDNKKEKIEEGISLFSSLPQPKNKEAVALEETDDEFMKKKEATAGDIPIVSPPTNDSADNQLKRKLLNLPQPKKEGEKKRVKISIPSLEEIGADSDSEEDEPKKPKGTDESKRKSTLFAILPKPRHSVSVGANKNKVFSKEANRPLVPHTLTKKKEPQVKDIPGTKKKETKHVKSLVNVDVSDSDSEDNDDVSSQNFFSLGNVSSKPSTEDGKRDGLSSTVAISGANPHSKPSVPSGVEIHKETISSSAGGKGESLTDTKKTVIQGAATKTNSYFSNSFTTNKKDKALENSLKSQSVQLSDNKKSTSIEKKNTPVISIENTDSKLNSGLTASKDSRISSAPHYAPTTTESSITHPYKNVTSPYGNVTAPYGNITAPYGNVTAPYRNVTKAYGTEPYSNVTGPYGNVTEPYGNVTKPYGNVTEPYIAQNYANKSYPSQTFNSFTYQNGSNVEAGVEINQEMTSVDHYNRPNEDLPIEKEALLALQGRKRRKEEIKLVDINADDIQANQADHLKNFTAPAGYKSQTSKKDQPSSSQKRKHQITYLAFQAKERELLLQQQWADNKATKRETQSKYGF